MEGHIGLKFYYLKSFVKSTTKVICSLLVFICVTCICISATILNPSVHKYLLSKNNVYSNIQTSINASMDGIISSIKSTQFSDPVQQESLVSMLKNSTTPEIINMNIDLVRDGIFEYVGGKRTFLPDIYLNSSPFEHFSSNSDSIPTFTELDKIKRINLSIILNAINRNDIIDFLNLLRLSNYAVTILPGICILLFLMFGTIGLMILKNSKDTAKWLHECFITSGMTCLILVCSVSVYAHFKLSSHALASLLPLNPNIMSNYLNQCVSLFLIIQSIFGIIFLVATIVMRVLLYKWLKLISFKIVHHAKNIHFTMSTKSVHFTCIILLCITFVFVCFKLVSVKQDFEYNNFSSVIYNFTNRGTITEQISAKKDAVYLLQVKIIDENKQPIPQISVNITGNYKGDPFNQTLTSNENGEIKLTLSKSVFRISILKSELSKKYNTPSPFLVELKNAGTTIITVGLKPSLEEGDKTSGVAEVEVLDKTNTVVSNIALESTQITGKPYSNTPQKIFSYTNAKGIAVFKLEPAIYKVTFPEEERFREKYSIPAPLEINVQANTITRYTIQLVDK